MAKAATYLKDIRAQVKADHGGKVPDHLNLTIRNYANALEIRDTYRDTIIKEGAVIFENGSMGRPSASSTPSVACSTNRRCSASVTRRLWEAQRQRQQPSPKTRAARKPRAASMSLLTE